MKRYGLGVDQVEEVHHVWVNDCEVQQGNEMAWPESKGGWVNRVDGRMSVRRKG